MVAAQTADADRSRGRAGPLGGVPLVYKDMFDRRGHQCSFGSRLGQIAPPAADAPAIRRLEHAGAIMVAAASMAEFALGPTGHNPHYGPCRNPWNLSRISGGSSSGPAAAIAAGLVCGAIGSDTGGSIRIPAACCGVVGLKPTQRRVSREGAMPLSWSMDCIGPLARTVEDCAELFCVLADLEPALALLDDPARHRYRLVYPREELARELPEDIVSAIDSAATALHERGVEVIARPLPEITKLHALADIVQKAECAAVHADNLRRHREAYGAATLRRIESGLSIAAPDYVLALRQRSAQLQAFLLGTLPDADALLLPTLGLAVPKIDETDELAPGTASDVVFRMTRWTRWTNYLDVPALTVPCGLDANAMPIGLQLIGRPFAEPTLLKIGRLFESAGIWSRSTASLRATAGSVCLAEPGERACPRQRPARLRR